MARITFFRFTLFLAVLFAFLTVPAVAQDDTTSPTSATSAATSSNTPASSASSTPAASSSPSSTPAPSSAVSTPSSAATAATSSAPTSMASSNGGSSVATSTGTDAGGAIYTNAPSLYGVGAPPLIVPDTSGAPFMQRSDVPEGTVFIIVGTILGFFGLAVLAWRALVAWLLARSVRRAASKQYSSDSKSPFGLGDSSGYSNVYSTSNMSLDHLAAANTAYNGANAASRNSVLQKPRSKDTRRTSRAPGQTNSSLFFSPTAGVGADSHGPTQGLSSRTSTYLPAGYYASGAATVGGTGAGAGVGAGNSTSSLNRQSSPTVSPPSSPGLRPTHHGNSSWNNRPTSRDGGREVAGGHERRPSRLAHVVTPRDSMSSLGVAPQGRAPSAYLDDLFENHGNGPRERF